MQNDPNKVSAFAEYTVNIGNYSSVKIMGGLSLPLEPTSVVSEQEQLESLTRKVMATLKPIADEIGQTRQPDLPRATGTPKAASVRTNRPTAVAPTPAQDLEDLGNGKFMATVSPDKVWFKGFESKTKKGKFGPGSIVDAGGNKYFTYEAADLKTADEAAKAGSRVTIIYEIDDYQKNKIIKGGVAVFGGTTEDVPTDDASNY